MGISLWRLRKRKEAKETLTRIFNDPTNALIVHYSCESFYDRPEGRSPRITSIAVRNLGTGQTVSFSIHQMAERRNLEFREINENYDDLEREMLREFYQFVERNQSHMWLHWNMRDANYGFPALAHRFMVLGGNPRDIHESRKCDLARLLVSLYGVGYIGHPRLASLVKLNHITDLNALNGEQEAEAFQNGQYAKLHQSTLRKVDMLANIAERTEDGTLKTIARLNEIYGGYCAFAAEQLKNHWIVALIGLVASVLGILKLVN